jgi:hypothetical protein
VGGLIIVKEEFVIISWADLNSDTIWWLWCCPVCRRQRCTHESLSLLLCKTHACKKKVYKLRLCVYTSLPWLYAFWWRQTSFVIIFFDINRGFVEFWWRLTSRAVQFSVNCRIDSQGIGSRRLSSSSFFERYSPLPFLFQTSRLINVFCFNGRVSNRHEGYNTTELDI